MKVFEAQCDDCKLSARRGTRLEAKRLLRQHTCAQVCNICRRTFLILVDGVLCIRCDSMTYPDLYPIDVAEEKHDDQEREAAV